MQLLACWLPAVPAASVHVAFRETVERLAHNEFLDDLPFEFDAMGTVLGHGLRPPRARQSRSIPNLQDVHRQGRTPVSLRHPISKRRDAMAQCYDVCTRRLNYSGINDT